MPPARTSSRRARTPTPSKRPRAPSARRSQQERREASVAALVDAALECLCESGLASFNTYAVCSRAGMSQGSLFRYFPTKAHLLSATIAHLFDELRADYEARFMKLPPGERNLSGGIALLWGSMSDPRLAAAYELYTAARTDKTLRVSLARVVDAHVERIHQLADTLMPVSAPMTPGWFHAAVDLAILSMQGLVLQRMALPDPPQEEQLMALLHTLVNTGPLGDPALGRRSELT